LILWSSKQLRKIKKVILFLLAPLTNFVKSYQKDSNIINKIAYITIMRGTKSKGNIKFNQKA